VKAQGTQTTWANTDHRVAATPVAGPRRPLGVTRPTVRTRPNIEVICTLTSPLLRQS
jgi:hypothetical protein